MADLSFDFSKVSGNVKVLNAMNNGPTGKSVRATTNFDYYKALEIPYARNHDASFSEAYGGEHTVDVHRIFKRFEADENDPKSYVFEPTDSYVANTYAAGTKVFYRLGASIEHGYKYGTYPPRDFGKWARICEHIIRHYNEGWADGFNYGIEYWEIWNEPDNYKADGANPCWQGTPDEFIDFYEVVSKHLKSCFPSLKIGGPAFCSSFYQKDDFKLNFLKAVKERNMPLDFYSFHGYLKNVEKVFELSRAATDSLKLAGFDKNPELIYNEWNYVRAWRGEEYVYSREMSRGIKGASMNIGVMCATQESDIDMLMYYDARPSNWCGLFNWYDYTPLKPYYAYYLFREIPRLKGYVKAPSQCGSIWSLAATDGETGAIILTNYNDDDNAPSERVRINISKEKRAKYTLVEYYLVDGEHNGELVREELISSDEFTLHLDVKLFDTYLIKLTPKAE